MTSTWKAQFAHTLADPKLSSTSFSEANGLKRENLPRYLFKYRAFAAQNLDILRTDRIWLASPSTFNDPFDSAVLFDPEDVFNDIRKDHGPSPRGKSLLYGMLQGD